MLVVSLTFHIPGRQQGTFSHTGHDYIEAKYKLNLLYCLNIGWEIFPFSVLLMDKAFCDFTYYFLSR